MLSAAEFESYVVCKGLDVIGGDFKRYLYQCVENNDEWALAMHASVSKMNGELRELQMLVERVRQSESALGRVCKEVVTSMHVPMRRVSMLQQCVLTGLHSTACIDVSRAWKTDNPVIVHERFEYFVVMLYFCHRLEHVVRSYTKAWLTQQPETDLADLAERFRAQSALFHSMWERFVEGYAHVKASLEQWLMQGSL